MQAVKVIAATGGVVRGPAKVRLTREQQQRREPILGPAKSRKATVKIAGGQELSFKYGEVFEIDEAIKLNSLVFEGGEATADDHDPEPPETGGGADGDGKGSADDKKSTDETVQ